MHICENFQTIKCDKWSLIFVFFLKCSIRANVGFEQLNDRIYTLKYMVKIETTIATF